ncbi:MAG: membrane protein insertase YidC, partial [Gemmatimonadetes bacterium]|nr:membrane protein insertase YidC [Gemmatimonadota bacterium]
GRPEIEKDQVGAVTMVGPDIVRDATRKIGEEGKLHTSNVEWTAIKGKYFAVALEFDGDPGAEVLIRKAPAVDRAWFEAKIPIRSPMGSSDSFGLYLVPLDFEILQAEGHGLERMLDLGWAIIEPISRLLLKFMNFLYKFIPNYGWVIIIVSVVSKVILHPLSRKQFQSMKDMQNVQGPMQKLREKHKDDPQKLNKEMMELYKREGINPMGGCFPMLLQMPVFFALFQVLNKTIELRHASWFGWINDLSRPEVLFEMPFPIPFLGSGFSLLPIVMGGLMFWQQKMSTVDPRQKAMVYMMPILFTFLFYRFPSGLVLYWLVNNVMSIAQQRSIQKAGGKPKKDADAGPGADATTPQPAAGKHSKPGKAKARGKKSRATAKEIT